LLQRWSVPARTFVRRMRAKKLGEHTRPIVRERAQIAAIMLLERDLQNAVGGRDPLTRAQSSAERAHVRHTFAVEIGNSDVEGWRRCRGADSTCVARFVTTAMHSNRPLPQCLTRVTERTGRATICEPTNPSHPGRRAHEIPDQRGSNPPLCPAPPRPDKTAAESPDRLTPTVQ
jgi:hypothetical protein